ncbi:AsmA-like C-terminal region-containing protein [Mesorhizobium sp. LHD-90]|uniref:AsmA-like C-terminal region-containing protein n=1 Tax=Mesorhizobium sp. LHD-90 TaxID=3071414 RepID=UPI0027E212B1|nr:AsmA-like C-terminal region-containing protein [Mesorhizobium sp. LHD-90]MDQ6433512.1 AsmA-like C-terminal region-containing protein [Mesorhizobium sp. LHD-90]
MILARLFISVGGLFVLVLTVALVAPYFIDWTSYRADFEREASAILGRKVVVQGDADARLLPFPSVTFSNVAVGGGAHGEPAMTVETFSMDAELAPFLRGEFLIFDMRMVKPRGILDIAEDGTIDWAVRPSSPIPASKIALEKLTVTDGEVQIRHRLSGRTHFLTALDAQMAAKSLAGPWRFEGKFKFDGVETGLSATTGTLDENGRMRLRVKAAPTAHPLSVDTDGEVHLRPEGLVYSGSFRAAETVAREAGAETTPQAETQKQPAPPGYRLDGQFTLDSRKLDIAAFRFETGPLDQPYTADGTASLDFGAEPRFSVKASGAQMRFDEALGGTGGAASLSLEQRMKAFEAAMLGLPRPAIPGSIEVNLPAVVVGDTTIRDVRLAAEPQPGGWAIRSAGATLPGRTTLEADGFLKTDGVFGFNGNLLLAVAQPSGFAAWVAKDIDDAIRKLPAAGFSAKVDVTERRQVFRDLELVLGGARFKGEIDSRQPPDVRPSILVRLDGGGLDVDGLAAFASLFVSDAGRNRFAESDLDLDVRAGPVTVAGLSAETVDTAFRLRQGQVEIDRLSIGGLAGASISATGTIKGLPDNATGDIDASIVAVDLAPLAKLAAENFPDNYLLGQLQRRIAAYPSLLADARFDLVGSAATNGDGSSGMALSLQGNAGGSALSASLSGNGDPAALGKAKMALTLSARNEDATALLALLGLRTLSLGMTGAGELTASAKGVAETAMETTLELKGDRFLATFAGPANVDQDGFSAKGKASVEAADIEPWLMTAGVSLPGMGLGMAAEFSAQADLGSGLLVLSGMDAVINESAVAGDLNVSLKEETPNFSGALVLDELHLDPFLALMVGDEALKSAEGGWPSAQFRDKAILPFTGAIDVSAATLSAGTASAYDATLSLGLGADGFRIDNLKATFDGGKLSGRFELKNNGGLGLASGQMQLTGMDLSSEAAVNGLTGTGDFSATASGSGKSVAAIAASLSGSGTAAIRGLSISGVNEDAFPELLARADAIGRDIDAAKTASFAPEIVGSGSFAAGNADVAFTVANGIVRAPPVSLENALARLSAEVRADLNTGDVSATGTLTYAAGEQALTGSDPSLGFVAEGPAGNVTIDFDSGPLAQFLTQRALEREQARVEAMQAVLLEKQRLRREVRYYAALQAERNRLAAEAHRKAEEEARRKADEEARRKAEEEARRKAAEEAQRQAEEAARVRAEQERQRLEDEARRKAEQDASLKAEQERQAAAQAEEARRQTEDVVRRRAAEDARQAEEASRRAAEQAVQRPVQPEADAVPLPQAGNGREMGDYPPDARPKPPSTLGEVIRSLTGG